MLLLISEAPMKPDIASRRSSKTGFKPGMATAIHEWLLVLVTAVAQLLLQGANASLVQWLAAFGALKLSNAEVAPMLVTVFQASVTLGNLAAAQYQQWFQLWNLAIIQIALVAVGAALWWPLAYLTKASFVAVAWYGLVGGPTVTYFNTLL